MIFDIASQVLYLQCNDCECVADLWESQIIKKVVVHKVTISIISHNNNYGIIS